jgi:hypothetical protein
MIVICTANISKEIKYEVQKLLDNGVSLAEVFDMIRPSIILG